MPTQTWFKPEEAYREGKHLTLFPYEPDRPHASGQYHFNPLPEDLPKGHIRNFDTATDFSKTQAKIQIQEIIRQGVNRKSQIFRCSVSQPPEEHRPAALQEPFPPSRDTNGRLLPGQLVAKVFDYDYYPSDFSAPWPNDEEADGNHCREHAVYAYYRRHGKTGYPHIIPQFYGSWVSKIFRGHDKNNQPMFRYVGLILIEYINGYSVENLCLRERDGEYFGPLQPSKRTVPFRSLQRHQNRRDNVTEVRFDREMRQYVIKEMVHGVVVGMHLGVEHQECEPWNLFVSMHNGLDILEKPRVVLLDHSYTQVWSLTKYAETQGYLYCLQKLPYPPHPRERCSVVALNTFQGWWPPHNYDKNKFIEWMCRKDVFGPHVEARSVLDPLLKQQKEQKKQKKLWEHSYNKYSTFATLDAIEAKEDEVYAAGIASKILQFVRMNEDLNRDGRGEERERAITEGVEECAATSAMTSDSYTLWNRSKVRELRERRRQAEAQALSPPPQKPSTISLDLRSNKSNVRYLPWTVQVQEDLQQPGPPDLFRFPSAPAGFNYETPDLFRLASARSGSGDEPPDLFRLSSTRPGSGDEPPDPFRLPSTRSGSGDEPPDTFGLPSARPGFNHEPPNPFGLPSARPGSVDEPPDLLTRSSVPSVFRDTPPTWIVPHQFVPAP
ncbi:hypothetical protein CGCS363_v007157 [Colletotrichum siamense]|uniref:uncharacterized protein n=1 Tax=Colletotrichum siamense TaxID=690259 RepID=UPI0018730F50|nr:uncharacterized protein CGCS363_v007157 [Colletotrichum siamense]KAF5500130.1 hypothetical protein CGCS363_v007157 [Colletotrichum siamense]